ncbi:MAG: Hsp20/alpha crystallin family protein [Gammaproteobacteria bacterium]|nr:Hsp20/alpha crystallin family protein [Gammaproteobacteria bacterium]
MNDQQEVTTRSATEPQAETGGPDAPQQPEWTLVPDVDIYEDAEGIVVQADMPGVSRERLDIQVNKDSLTIEGEARIDMPEGMEAVSADIRSTHYRRSFVLSAELDTDKIDAKLGDGVLTLRIPKRAEARPRKIEVSTG